MIRIPIALLIGWALLQSPAPSPDRISPAQGAFFALSVADLDASARWYSEKLGLQRVAGGGRMGRLEGYVVLEGNGWIVELVRHDDSTRPSAGGPEMVQGIMKAGAIVGDFDAAVSLLRARGVEIVIGPFPPRDTMRANLIFKDNAGNLIQLFGGYARK